MTKVISVMLDLETWGTDPGRDIRSIGACVFQPDTGEVCGADGLAGFGPSHSAPGTFYQNVENPSVPLEYRNGQTAQIYKYPLTRDPNTVEWWSHPDRADAAAQLLTDVVPLHIGLIDFGGWLRVLCNDDFSRLRIWGHGANMDEPMLRHAYQVASVGFYIVGGRESAFPWHYRSPRDTRTAFDMAGVEDHTAFLDSFKSGTFHNALCDSICQARAVCEAFARIRVASSSN